MNNTQTLPASTDAHELLELALDQAANLVTWSMDDSGCFDDGDELDIVVTADVEHHAPHAVAILAAILHIDATPAAELIAGRIRS